MDDEFLEKMESFWFFSSVFNFKTSSHLLTQNVEMGTKNRECTDEEKQNREVEEKTAAEEPTQNDLKVKECHNCIEKASPAKRRGNRRGRKSKEIVQKWIQQNPPAAVQSEQRTPFAVIYDSQLGTTGSNEWIGISSQFAHLTVPRVRDDLEMKAQLRSWAYAVACSVR